ncbi:MAG: MarR family winged helix-turn-helix transcriptional regulator [Pararhizobium sp.]
MAKKNKGSGKKKAAKSDLAPGLFATLTQAARTSRGVIARRLAASGLYAGQDAVMLALDGEDGQTPSAIAAALGVRAPTVTKTINRLSAQGFVTKKGSASDGRLAHVFLTEAGRGAIAVIRGAIREGEAAAVEGLTGKEVKTLVKLLRKVDANLQEAAAAAPEAEEPEEA